MPRAGGHNVGIDKHRIVNDNVAVDKLVIVNDGGADNVSHGACRSFLTVWVVAAATTSASTSTTSAAAMSTASPMTTSASRRTSPSTPARFRLPLCVSQGRRR